MYHYNSVQCVYIYLRKGQTKHTVGAKSAGFTNKGAMSRGVMSWEDMSGGVMSGGGGWIMCSDKVIMPSITFILKDCCSD